MDIGGLLSTFTLATFTFPSYSFDNSSITGPIARQGPHHSAQKSTTVSLSEASTSDWKFASLNSFAILLILFIQVANLSPLFLTSKVDIKLGKNCHYFCRLLCTACL